VAFAVILDSCVLTRCHCGTRCCAPPRKISTCRAGARGSPRHPGAGGPHDRRDGRAFDDAEVPATVIAALETTMNNEPEDRHVLAAAVASHDAQTIVTTNLRHFPAEACEPLAIEVIHPDAFLCDLLDNEPERMHAALAEQAAALTRPPMTVPDVLDRLHDTVPTFVSRIRNTPAPSDI
jgi:hypothetical protein